MAQSNVFANIASSNLVGVPEDISDEIFHLAPWGTPFLNRVGMSSLQKPCSNTTHQYLEIQERPTRTTLNGAISSTSSTTFVFDDEYAQAGDNVQINEEVITLGATSDNLTFTGCSRSSGVGAAATHADGVPVLILGKPRVQGSASNSTSDLTIYPDTITNYTQIFKKDIVVSGTANALNRYGRGTATEFDYVANRQLMTLKKELENSLLWGFATAPSANTTAGTAAGVYERIAAVNTSDLSDAAQTLGNMRTAARTSVDYGGDPNLILCSLYAADVFDSFGSAHILHVTDPMDPVVQTYGGRVSRLFVSGKVMDIVPMDTIAAQLFVLDSRQIGCGPLQGRQFVLEPIAKDGDRIKGEVIGEYTFECRVPRSGYVFSSVKYS